MLRLRRRPAPEPVAKRPDLWELEVVYNDFRVHQRLLKEQVRAAKAEGRQAWRDGQLDDRELARMEDLLEDLSFWRGLLVASYVKAGGRVEQLQEQYARAVAADPDLAEPVEAAV